jgi:hypothetical protein
MTLLADREYIGKSWFKFLKENKIHFVIRLRVGDYFEDVNATKGKDYGRMQGKCALKNKLVRKQIFLNGEAFTIGILPNPKINADEPVMIFLTTLPKAAELYAKRWKIECLFRHLKTNGYNLEDLNRKDPNKNLLMMAIVITACILAIREGWKRKSRIPTQHYSDGAEWPEADYWTL